MRKFADTVSGIVLVPLFFVHVMAGFMLMIATIFMGIQDVTGVALHPVALFLLFVLSVIAWSSGYMCTVDWVQTGSRFFGPVPPNVSNTLVGVSKRALIGLCLWLAIYGALALNPASRSVMIVPLALVGRPAVPLATALLDDPSWRVRRSAIDVLKWIGPAAKSSAPEIAKHLDDPNDQVRFMAHSALSTLNPDLLPK